jgi:site-specific recombinase XerD
MCLGTVLPGTIEGYSSHLRQFSKFCALRGLNPAEEVVVEKYLFFLFKNNADQSAALQFRPALRKAAKAAGAPDPFLKGSRLSLMVNTFCHDIRVRIVKCILPERLDLLVSAFSSCKSLRLRQAVLLFCLSLTQGLRMASLVDCRYNDFLIDDGMLYIHNAKGHKAPIWTMIHPDAAQVFSGFSALFPERKLSDRLSEGWSAQSLNSWLADMCRLAGIDVITWHCARHTFAQFMNDLNYPNEVMRALGTWKCLTSLKSYVRIRTPLQFPPDVVKLHEGYIRELSSQLRRQKGKMLWFSSSSS